MKILNRILAVMLVFVLVMALMPTMTFAAEYDSTVYNPGDVAVINRIIDNNGLKGYKKNDPKNWDFAGWIGGGETPRRIEFLLLRETNLKGSMSLAGLDRLTYLVCGKNKITELDVSKNTELNCLDIDNNELTRLEVSTNSKLEYLYCYDNKLTTLDISKNTELAALDIDNNKITVLDVSQNRKLRELKCGRNRLTRLDVSTNTELNWLSCSEQELEKLDISKNIKLEYLYCESNRLKGLDTSNNSELLLLRCQWNRLKELNTSNNQKLIDFICDDNLMTAINTKINDKTYDINTEGNGYVGLVVPIDKEPSMGTFALASNKTLAKEPTTFTVSAKPKEGWKFVNWTQNGKVVSTKKIAVFKRNKSNKLVANFKRIKFVGVKSIKIRKTLTLKRGKTFTLRQKFTPSNTTDKRITWSSSRKRVATVNSKGVVRGIRKGKATIKVRTVNGKTAKCVVSVK